MLLDQPFPIAAMAVALGVSFVAALVLTPIAGRLGERFGLVDRPRKGEVQEHPAPRSGGYGLVVAFILAVVASFALIPHSGDELTRVLGLIIGIVLVLPIALVDDLKRLGPFPQLIGQIGLAVVAMAFGLVIRNVANPFGGLIPLPMIVAVPFTLVWIVGMINTLNWFDTVDGLAAGMSAIAAIVLFARSVSLGQYTVSLLPLALAGACIGFLRYNFNPARIFMGTSGSTFLGFALAILALIGGAKIATAAFVLGLPIIDTGLVIVQRSARRRSPFVGGDDAHLPHKLIARGLSAKRISLTIYAVCAAGGMLAMTLNGIQKLWIIVVVGAIATALALRFVTTRSAS